MPAVSQLLLLLVILGRANRGAGGWTYESSSRWLPIAAGVVAMGLYLTCWMTGLAPVIGARSKLASGEYELYKNGRPSVAERSFRLAAEADPWAAEPCERLSELAFRSWLASDEDNEPAFARCLGWQQKAIALNPKHPGGYRVLGQMYLSRFGRTRDLADASAAAAAYAQAVELYPNHAQTQSELAGALSKAREVNKARAAASRALELDAINEKAGHVDKQLRPSRRELMKKILDEGESIGRRE
jgi:tetratricopeptide (TPR) repeat protein